MRRRELTAAEQAYFSSTALSGGDDVDPNRDQSVYHHSEKPHIPILD